MGLAHQVDLAGAARRVGGLGHDTGAVDGQPGESRRAEAALTMESTVLLPAARKTISGWTQLLASASSMVGCTQSGGRSSTSWRIPGGGPARGRGRGGRLGRVFVWDRLSWPAPVERVADPWTRSPWRRWRGVLREGPALGRDVGTVRPPNSRRTREARSRPVGRPAPLFHQRRGTGSLFLEPGAVSRLLMLPSMCCSKKSPPSPTWTSYTGMGVRSAGPVPHHCPRPVREA